MPGQGDDMSDPFNPFELLCFLPPGQQRVPVSEIAFDLKRSFREVVVAAKFLQDQGYEVVTEGFGPKKSIYAKRRGYDKIKRAAERCWQESLRLPDARLT